jgi:hypothetical protein
VKQVRWSPAADGGTLRLGNRAFKMARISRPNWAEMVGFSSKCLKRSMEV